MTLLESSEVQQVFCINSALTHIFDFYPILFNSPAQYYSSQDFLSPCFLMDIIPPHRMPQLSTQMQHIFRNLDKMRVFFEAILYLLRSWDTCHFIHLTGIQPFFFFSDVLLWCRADTQYTVIKWMYDNRYKAVLCKKYEPELLLWTTSQLSTLERSQLY